jgi:hypothetical protein
MLHDRAARRRFLLPKQLLLDEGPHRLELRLHSWRALVLVWGRYCGDQSSGSGVSVGAHVQAVRVVGGTEDPVDPSSQEQYVSCLDV